MPVIRPPITGSLALDSWTNQVTQHINTDIGSTVGAGEPASGAVGLTGADGDPAPHYAEVTLYTDPVVGATPAAPTATITWTTGALSSITAGWSQTPPTVDPTSTDNVYSSRLIFIDAIAPFATTTTTGDTPIEGPVGLDAPHYAEVTLYTDPAVGSLPTAPAATITWTTGALSSITAGWSQTPPTVDPTSTDNVYSSKIIFIDTTAPFTTTTETGTTPVKSFELSSLYPAAVISKHLGYADYNDASTASVPVTLVANTWTTLPNDGLGSFTNESYLPENVTTLLDAGGGIDISELELGSDILIRPDFTVTPSANNSALFFRFSLGTGAGSYTLESSFGRLDLGAGIPYRHALQAMYVYAGDTNTRDNPINLQIKLSGGGTVVNAGMAIKVLST